MKWTRRILLGLIVLAGLVTALWWEENWRGQKIWEESCARLRAAGEPVDIADIIPPMIPDEENVAAAPIFADLSRLGPWGQGWGRGRTYPRSRPMSSTDFSQVKHWAEFLRSYHTTLVPTQPFDHPADEVIHYYSQWDGPWREVRSALARPRCRWPLEYEKGETMEFPHLSPSHAMSINVRGWMVALAAKGNSDAFHEILTTLLQLERSVTQEPTLLIGHLVGNSILGNALLTWQNSLPLLSFKEGQLAHLQAQLERLDAREVQVSLRNEAVLFLHATQKMTSAEMGTYLVESGAVPWRWGSKAERLEQALFKIGLTARPEGWRLADLATLQEALLDLSVRSADPLGAIINKERFDGLESQVERTVSRLGWYTFSRYILAGQPTVYKNMLIRTAQAHAIVRSAILWCACERFRLRHGRMPQHPQELVPDFLTAIPKDPVDGKPLRFVVKDGGRLLIYSIGSDGIDNGGIRGVRSQNGDWGWASDPMLLVGPDEIEQWKEEEEDLAKASN